LHGLIFLWNFRGLSTSADGALSPFNTLLERLRRTHEQLEGFNSGVAHELNTPLSIIIIISSTKLALRQARDSEALREMPGSNLEDLHHLSGIIEDMLFLNPGARRARPRLCPVWQPSR
jgi:two-component system, OmpR family, heavy metal sensor histidine kinase CusS